MGNACSKEEKEFHEDLRVNPVQALLVTPVFFLLDYPELLSLENYCKSTHHPVASMLLDIWLSSSPTKRAVECAYTFPHSGFSHVPCLGQ